MKRVIVFVLLAVALDWGIGGAFGFLYRRTFTGERGGLTNYALAKDADLLVLGSSRAQYQVMPSVLRERLAMTAYNAGLKGHDFLYSVLLFDLWKRLHAAPRAALIQVDIESLLERGSELEAAQIFSPYLDESPLVREVLYSADAFKPLVYRSRAYRFNGKAFSIARNLFDRPDFEADGFIPALGTLNPATDPVAINALDQDATALEQARRPYSATKLRYLRDLAAYGSEHGMRVILFHTPLYQQDPEAHGVWAERIHALAAAVPGMDFIDICEATHPHVFRRQPALYNDANHLNARGAVIFSNLLADELKTRLGSNVDARLSERTAAAKAQTLN
jgi:hypothetical protein